jgi:PBP1b-binding outer membrane lipoprotein LpoB
MILVIAVFLSSCGSSTNTPSAAAEKIVNLMQDGDYDEIVDLMYFETSEGEDIEAQKEMFVALMDEKAGKSIDKKGGLEDYEVLGEEMSEDGKTASVKVKYLYGDGSEETQDMEFVLEDGEWLLEMNK